MRMYCHWYNADPAPTFLCKLDECVHPFFHRIENPWALDYIEGNQQGLAPMAKNVTNELILEHLKSIQSKLTKVDGRLGNIETDLRAVKGHMASFMQSELRQDSTMAEMQTRLDRIERRLDLNE